MLSRLREHFGTAGLVVAIVALVAALGGGAYAATGGSGDGKASASAAKGKPGPRGKTGKTGPAGPQGPAGPAGAKGDTGPAGSNGTNGTNGVTGPTGAKGATGATGKNGVDGETGFTETLPSEMTETGGWVFGEMMAAALPPSARVETAISFPIPLAAAIPAANVHLNPLGFEGTEGTDCPGKASKPAAKPGHLCVYLGSTNFLNGEAEEEFVAEAIRPLDDPAEKGASPTGAVIAYQVAPEVRLRGSWAVTAP